MAYSLASLTAADAMQAVYIGYYNRAADPHGFNFWLDLYNEHLDGAADGDAGLSLAGIANDFATQAETKSVYPFFNAPALATEANATAFLTSVYDNLFERAPDAAGLAFWLDQLMAGTTPAGEIVLAIIEGAQGSDVDTLNNKIEAANYWSSEAAINGIGTAENPITEDAEAFAAAAAAVAGAGDPGFDADDLAASQAATDAFITAYLTPAPEPEPEDLTFVLTDSTDILSGGEGDDTFKANQDTLNTDDELDGAGGTDTLELSVANGAGSVFVAPTLNSIEVLEVNGPNLAMGQDITLDLSNADGYQVLRSFQTTTDGNPGGSLVAFRDIQDVNGTDLEIIDTNADHRFTYDSNAFVTTFGGDDDAVDMMLQEVDGSTIDLALENAVPGTPGGDFRSHVDIVNITSMSRQQVNNTTSNFVQDLNVGPVFNVLNIDGDADLEIEEFLDDSVTVVDAEALNAKLALDLLGQAGTGGLAVNGAVDSTRIDVSGNTNGLFVFQDAADLLRIGNSSDTGYSAQQVTGNVGVFMNGGDDTAILNITGQQNVSLGAGNDTLTINGDVNGRSNVLAGDGNDSVTLNGLSQSSSNDYLVQLGAGNDSLVANQNGNHEVYGEDGQDSITINGDGDQNIDSGADNDSVTINGDGVHTVSLGGGNDALIINGSRLSANNIDNTAEDRQTVINGDAGDDTVVVTGDHYLLASLGAGSDSIELNTDELTSDDIIYGAAAGVADTGIDTLILNNDSGSPFSGLVDRSDTSGVAGIDVFDLRDSNIQLVLSSDNFDTALNSDIVVTTVNADHVGLPLIYPEIYQGMSRADYEDAAVKYFGGDGVSVAEAVQAMNDALINAGVTSIGIHDTDASGDKQTFTGGETYADGSNGDTVEFQSEVGGSMVVNLLDIPMSVMSGRNFELQGGNIRDIVIADDASISGRLVLDFDASDDTAHSAEDTLVMVDGGTITAADLRNVTGLEILELMSNSNDAQLWNIELNDRVINQTTANAPLIIRVDPDVPEGSIVNIELDPSIWSATATKDVIIETVANAQIFIDGVLVTEPDFGTTDFNPGGLGTITVVPRLLFTENTDSLVGTSENDTFIFDSISELNQADSADGLDGHDTLLADFVTVSNQGESLYEQLNAPQLVSIEEVRFDTGMNVQMTHLDGGPGLPGSDGVLDGMLNTVVTGSGNDTLLDMEAIGADSSEGYFLRNGDDFFSTIGQGGNHHPSQIVLMQYGENGPYYVDGGAGDDEAVIRNEDDLALGTDIEHITLEGNADATVRTKLGTDGSTMTITGRLSTNNHNDVTLSSSIMAAAGGLATVVLEDIEDVVDNGGDNNIVMDSARGGIDGDSNVALNAGTDSLTVTKVDDLDVSATAGAKTVNVGGTGATGSVNTFDYNVGEPGNNDVDTITANVARHVDVRAAGGDDVVNVKTTDVGAGDFINNPAVYVDGGAGNDTITATSNQSWVKVDGGTGADTINVTTKTGGTATIDTGLGGDGVGDTVNLYTPASGANDGGIDTIVFGNIDYDATQNVDTANTTQNFLQKGMVSPVADVEGVSDSIDTINNFNAEAGIWGVDDVFDFSAFVSDEPGPFTQFDIVHADWTAGKTNVDLEDTGMFGQDAEIAVIAVNNGFELSAADIVTAEGALGIEMEDGSPFFPGLGDRAVAITMFDTDNDGGLDAADIYFIQDVDNDFGTVWAVDKVATVTFATEVGLTSLDTLFDDNIVIG